MNQKLEVVRSQVQSIDLLEKLMSECDKLGIEGLSLGTLSIVRCDRNGEIEWGLDVNKYDVLEWEFARFVIQLKEAIREKIETMVELLGKEVNNA